MERTERAIADLEAQNEAGDEPAAPRLPADLAEAQRLRAEVRAARQALAASDRRHVNLTDPDARLLRAAGGYLTGYNAQAMAVTVRYEAGAAEQVEDAVSAGNDEHAGGEHIGDEESENRSGKGEHVGNVGSVDGGGEGDQEPGEDRSGREAGEAGGADEAGTRSGGLLITAADVTQDPTDQAQLLPMIEAAEQSGGPAAGLTLADAGYFSAANLAACAARATPVAIPERAVRPPTPTTTAASPTTPAPTATSVPKAACCASSASSIGAGEPPCGSTRPTRRTAARVPPSVAVRPASGDAGSRSRCTLTRSRCTVAGCRRRKRATRFAGANS